MHPSCLGKTFALNQTNVTVFYPVNINSNFKSNNEILNSTQFPLSHITVNQTCYAEWKKK